MKRKASFEQDLDVQSETAAKRRAAETSPSVHDIEDTSENSVKSAFQAGLFSQNTLESFRHSYSGSQPYPHAVVSSLIQPDLLRDVRAEIQQNISFTLKETDIYRIHQSGDLANLSNLSPEERQRLPKLGRLRDALYSREFRQWVEHVTGAGKISGKKTDMAVNVYTPGSYLLCHDDVIGSRRVSYILYLTDPDEGKLWQPDWGGGLRLYPTELRRKKDGKEVKVPQAEWSVNIPPSFGQLSFFAVRPGESYHDVEEVYHAANKREAEKNGGRIRMAISGWYHIPQVGEDGYEEGAEEAQAQQSSLRQLEGAADEFDMPQALFRHYDEARIIMNSKATGQELDPGDELDKYEDGLTEQDLTFLLTYITPSYLVPNMVEQFAESFGETSVLQIETFLCESFAKELKAHLTQTEAQPQEGDSVKHIGGWQTASPPHKHRYAYLQLAQGSEQHERTPIARLLTDLLHSHAFKKWLALVTGLKAPSLVRQHAIARRFQRGRDYALANAFPGDQPQIEFTINVTPSKGWMQDEDAETTTKGKATNGHTNGSVSSTGHIQLDNTDEVEFGGEEIYMAGDDDDVSVHSRSLPTVGRKADPAVYKSGADEEDDGILFTNSASWNQLSVVLRDKGTLRFVKYVSQAAPGDRWDIKGEVGLSEDAFDGEDEEEETEVVDGSDEEQAINEFYDNDEDEDNNDGE